MFILSLVLFMIVTQYGTLLENDASRYVYEGNEILKIKCDLKPLQVYAVNGFLCSVSIGNRSRKNHLSV